MTQRTTSEVGKTDATQMPSSFSMSVGVGVTAAVVLMIGGLGSRGLPVPESSDVYHQTVAAVDRAPRWVEHSLEGVSELGLLLLSVVLVVVAWRCRYRAASLARVLAGGVGVVVAYSASELLKVLIAQPRPCLGLDPAVAVARCPSATDWSLPSNHATIATALAMALLFAIPHAAWWAVPFAVAVGAARVAIGVHYPHDVATGMLLSAVVVTTTVLALQRPARSVAERVTRSLSRGTSRSPAGETIR